MDNPLSASDVGVQFYERAEDAAFVGYETNRRDANRLFAELQLVVTTVLEETTLATVEGITFHTEAPVIATWQVEAEWAEEYRAGDLPAAALLTRVLRRLETNSFQ